MCEMASVGWLSKKSGLIKAFVRCLADKLAGQEGGGKRTCSYTLQLGQGGLQVLLVKLTILGGSRRFHGQELI